MLKDNGIKISMDGRGGGGKDNVFRGLPWRSLKYEEVYFHAWETGTDVRVRPGNWIRFYHTERPHSSVNGSMPEEVYLTGLPLVA